MATASPRGMSLATIGMTLTEMVVLPFAILIWGTFVLIRVDLAKKKLRDERAEWGDEHLCKFCSNDCVNMTSPCFASECQHIEDYEGAKSCDDHVEQFWLATLAAGLRDLGEFIRRIIDE